MSTSNLIRWSGLASILGGLLFALAALLHPAGEDVAAILSPTWVIAHIFGAAASILIPLGLVGLYARQAEKAGWLGLLGFVLVFIGNALIGSGEVMSADVAPVLAAKAPSVIDEFFSPQPTASALVIILGLILGYILFGIATVRAGVLPRWGGWLLTIGVLVSFGAVLSHVVSIIAAAMLGLGLIWLGYALWSGTGETVRRPQPVGL